MTRPQFALRSLLLAMLVVAAFCGGIQFERERQRRKDEKLAIQPEFKLSREAKALKPTQ